MTADGNLDINTFGISKYSRNDAVLLKMNTTSLAITQNSICDCLNGDEFSTSSEIDNGTVYQFGQKDNIYLFILKYNLTNLTLLDQKIYLPETSYQLSNFKSFYSYGIANNGIVCLYLGNVIQFDIIIFSKFTLSILSNFELRISLDKSYVQNYPLEPGSNAKLVTTSFGNVLLFIPLYRYAAAIIKIDITDFSNPIYSFIGSLSFSFSGLTTFPDHCIANFIDTGHFLYYLASLNINIDRQYQISLLKISYNLDYLDS